MLCSHLPPADQPDPLRVDDAHLTETVLLLARGIATDLGFDRLPILADALEDAGCDNFALLNHLRSDEPHRVECWALRRLLRTTLMLPGNVPIAFAYCPPGTFLMGDVEAGREAQPVHPVTLTHGFYAGIYPVTQEQWRAVMGTTPSHFKGDSLPVEQVSWGEAQEFCAKVQIHTGRSVRLLTEAEWEYAARGGTTEAYYWGTDCGSGAANYQGLGTTEVGIFSAKHPHPWGLADVLGNVWEWCQDGFDVSFYTRSASVDPLCVEGTEGHKVIRGGSWDHGSYVGRCSNRDGDKPEFRSNHVGLRVVFTAT